MLQQCQIAIEVCKHSQSLYLFCHRLVANSTQTYWSLGHALNKTPLKFILSNPFNLQLRTLRS